ncbi:hypothetical protein Tco_0032114 [Tanacetum coccineum]
MCMFASTVSTAEPKNIKEAMTDSAWIEAMQEELHQFDRLQVWELVDKPFGKDEDQTIIRNKKDDKLHQAKVRFKFTWDSGSEGFWPLDLIAFSMPFHAVAFDIEKALLEELQFLDDNFVSWMSRKQDLIVDADTASRLGLQRQQNTIVLRFLVSIAISMTLHV